ncbi:MAG: hypothetical protein CM1200mP24_01490 [Gammaproteobacteria bacterium]|nr:MAG: hypothetical protein CM1200mP24_01490 [Gammaproteobacteria bacterium]
MAVQNNGKEAIQRDHEPRSNRDPLSREILGCNGKLVLLFPICLWFLGENIFCFNALCLSWNVRPDNAQIFQKGRTKERIPFIAGLTKYQNHTSYVVIMAVVKPSF